MAKFRIMATGLECDACGAFFLSARGADLHICPSKPATPQPPEEDPDAEKISNLAAYINIRGQHWWWSGVCVKCVKAIGEEGDECPALPLTHDAAIREATKYLRWAGEIATPQPSPLSRALDDFTARRKAKREVSAAALPDPPCRYCGMLAGAHREDCNRPDPPPWRYYPRDCSGLSRAMSTPLPHHPPMSARLMPWRGK